MSAWTETSTLAISPAGGKNWRVLEPLIWGIGEPIDGVYPHTIEVPAGFVCDLASIPRLLWWLLSPHGQPQVQAAVLHDWLYRCPHGRGPIATKRQADSEFYRAMCALGTHRVRAAVMWLAVRLAVTAGDW